MPEPGQRPASGSGSRGRTFVMGASARFEVHPSRCPDGHRVVCSATNVASLEYVILFDLGSTPSRATARPVAMLQGPARGRVGREPFGAATSPVDDVASVRSADR